MKSSVIQEKMGLNILAPLLLLLFFLCIPTLAIADVIIDATNFPDPNFRNLLIGLWYDNNGTTPGGDYGMDGILTDAEIASVTYLPVIGGSITDLTGIHHFSALKTLYCSDNSLTSLPVLPNGLEELFCINNQLTSLSPTLPSGLRTLHCSDNKLTSLPVLPDSLEFLNCEYNQLTLLPSPLPIGLTDLECNGNQLTSLPALPDSLVFLWCDGNLLTSLPPLPQNIEFIECGNNRLTALPGLPDSLTYLWCSNNQIKTLPYLPPNMWGFGCSNNQLTSLPPLPLSLITFKCDGNHLTSLDMSGIVISIFYDASNQSVPLTLDGDDTNGYSVPLLLNNPSTLNSGITYSSGILHSNSRSITVTPFQVETGIPGVFLSGYLTLNYRGTPTPTNRPSSNIPKTGDNFPAETLALLLGVALAGIVSFGVAARRKREKRANTSPL